MTPAYEGADTLRWDEDATARRLVAEFGSLKLETIGYLLGITRERVRQIKEKALVRLRHASRARFLETFLGT